MTEVNNTNHTTNINFDSTSNVSDTQTGKIAPTQNNTAINEGIESITYANDPIEENFTGDQKIGTNETEAYLQGLAFDTEEVQEVLGKDVKNVTAKGNPDETLTLTSTQADGSVSSVTKPITSFDIRELLKLLIAAFAAILTADRERALNLLTATVAALDAKIASMETAAQEQYKAAIASAVGQIVSGAVSIVCATLGGIASKWGPKTETASFNTGQTNTNITQTTKITTSGMFADLFNNSAMPLGKIVEGLANIGAAEYSLNKSEADIEVAQADALMEVLHQAMDEFIKNITSLLEFINKVLSVVQQLQQSESQTEKTTANI